MTDAIVSRKSPKYIAACALLLFGAGLTVAGVWLAPRQVDVGVGPNAIVVITAESGTFAPVQVDMSWQGPAENEDYTEDPLRSFPDGGKGSEPWGLWVSITPERKLPYRVEVLTPDWATVDDGSDEELPVIEQTYVGHADAVGHQVDQPEGYPTYFVIRPPQEGAGSVGDLQGDGPMNFAFPAVSLGAESKTTTDAVGQVTYRIRGVAPDAIQITGPPSVGRLQWSGELLNDPTDSHATHGYVDALGPVHLDTASELSRAARNGTWSGIVAGLGAALVVLAGEKLLAWEWASRRATKARLL